MSSPTPPESDALAVELRTAAEDMRDIPGGLGYFIELMERAASDRTTTAAALSAFRAVAVQLVAYSPDESLRGRCHHCGQGQGYAHWDTCPVALARAALEKYPEVTA